MRKIKIISSDWIALLRRLLILCYSFSVLSRLPDGTEFVVYCFVIRSVEALGAAACLTALYTIVAKTFPDRVAQTIVSVNTLHNCFPLLSHLLVPERYFICCLVFCYLFCGSCRPCGMSDGTIYNYTNVFPFCLTFQSPERYFICVVLFLLFVLRKL